METWHTLVLPSENDPPCPCGRTRVRVFRDGLEDLQDNMGCELGLEPLTGPLCPECQADDVQRARKRD